MFLCKHFSLYSNLISFSTDKATTSALLHRWIRQDQSPAISWTWRTPFSGELPRWGQWDGCGKPHLTVKVRRTVCLILKVCALCVCRYTGSTPNPPPGSHYTSPSENMWNTGSAYSMNQGMGVSGEHTQEHWELKQILHGSSRDFQPRGAV